MIMYTRTVKDVTGDLEVKQSHLRHSDKIASLLNNGFDPLTAGAAVTNTMNKKAKPTITVFHCINTFAGAVTVPRGAEDETDLRLIKLPCSSMVKDVFLLRAFEAGADAVIVLVCPEGACRYVEGNLRAQKRVLLVKNILDEIGLGGRRLALFHIAAGDTVALDQILRETRAEVIALGPNPTWTLPHEAH